MKAVYRIRPEPEPPEAEAIARALEPLVEDDDPPGDPLADGAWRRAAAREAVDDGEP